MENKQVLITANIHPYLQKRLEELGFTVTIFPEIERNKLIEIIPFYSILIITTYTKIDKEIIDLANQLKIIGRVGSGMENIDVEYCKIKNIVCLNSPEGNGNAVGEHSLAMLLALLNNITKANIEIKNNLFLREENRGEELDGKTIGIIGYGHTGSAFAKKLRGFDVEILVYDKYTTTTTNFVQNSILDELQRKSDVISFHIPYNTETHHLVDNKFIQQCRKNPILINTSRGAIFDTLAVLNALENNNIKGLCIDVFEDEPITKKNVHSIEVYQKLLSLKNVITTPHIAGWTKESYCKISKILMDKVEKIL